MDNVGKKQAEYLQILNIYEQIERMSILKSFLSYRDPWSHTHKNINSTSSTSIVVH